MDLRLNFYFANINQVEIGFVKLRMSAYSTSRPCWKVAMSRVLYSDDLMAVRYSTNWMGVANMQWYRDRGFTKKVAKVLEKDCAITDRKAGDVMELEEITEYYSCGRLDFWNPTIDSMFPDEMGVPPMRSEDWSSFGAWLDTFSSDDVLDLDQLVELYEQTNAKIQWANHD